MRHCESVHFFEDALTRAGHRRLRLPCDGRTVAQAALDAAGERVPAVACGGVTEHVAIVLNGRELKAGDPVLSQPLMACDQLIVAPAGPGLEPGTWIMIAIAITTSILSFVLTPRLGVPDQPSDNSEQRFGFDKFSRAAARGEPIPVVLGRLVRYGGVRVSELPGEGEDGDQMLRLLIVLGEGPFNRIGSRTTDGTKLVPGSGITGVYLNDQPIENFPGARVSVRMGSDSQTMIPGFVDTEVLREVGAGVGGALMANTSGTERTGGSASGEAITYTSVDPVDAMILRVRFATGLYTLSPQGQTEPRIVKWRYRTRLTAGPGTWSAWAVVSVTKAEQSAFTQAVRVDNLSGSGSPAQFDAQVERVSVEAADLTHADEMRLDSVVEAVYEQNKYKDLALLAVEITASEQISSVPSVSVDVEGLASLRIWDGVSDPASPTFTTGYSANPADQALAILTDTRWGSGQADDQIDFPSLLQARSNVPTWKDAGGVAHPFECNLALMDAKDVVDWVRTVCSCMRVTPVPSSRWMFVQERARDTAAETFGDGSIARDDGGDLLMQISYPATTGGDTTYNQIRGTFANADNDNETDPVVFPEAGELWLGGGDAEQPNPKDVRLDGVTSAGQAMGEIIYQMKRLRARRSVVEFTTTRPVVVCQPEERIDVACSVAGWGISGRILAGSTTAMVLCDRSIEIGDTGAYALRVTHVDGEIEVVAIDLPPGDYAPGTEITLAAVGLATAPAEGAEYAIGVSGIEVKPFLVESVVATRSGEEGADYRWKIMAGEYNAGVFDVTPADVVVIGYSNLGRDRMAPGPVVGLVASERIVNGQMVIELGWQQTPADAAHTAGFVVYRRLAGTTAWVAMPGQAVGRTHVDLTIVDTDRAYDFEVVARSPLGSQLSPYDPRHPIVSVALGLSALPPAAPGDLAIVQVDGNVYKLTWTAVDGAASYQVLTGGDSGTGLPNDGAEDCLVLGRTVANEYVVELAAGIDTTFRVRSASAGGRLSFDAAEITQAAPDAPTGQSVKSGGGGTYVADLSSDGTLTNAAWDGTDGRVEITDPTDVAGGVWESGAIDTGDLSLTELCIRAATSNNAEDFTIADILFGVPSIEADQWGVVSGSGATAVVGMLMPPFPDDAQAWVFEIATSEDGSTYTDYNVAPACTSLVRTLQYYKVRVTMTRKGGGTARPYSPALRGITVVATEAS